MTAGSALGRGGRVAAAAAGLAMDEGAVGGWDTGAWAALFARGAGDWPAGVAEAPPPTAGNRCSCLPWYRPFFDCCCC